MTAAANDAATEPSLIARREGPAGTLLMNRPRALNALDQAMIDGFGAAIEEWKADAEVELVVLEGAGGKAFCAGGDVRAMRQAVLDGDHDTVERFFTTEYAVNQGIAEFGKPWVSLIDGVCMGGGLGVSVHGSHRVVSENALLAMPETAIALFPDVGTSYVLPRLPGKLGLWIAMTGARLKGPEAVEAGLATHFVPRASLPALREALLTGDAGVVERFAQPVPPGAVAAQRPAIDRCFGAGSVPAIIAALEAEGTEWAASQLAILRRMSPTSLFVTHELLARAAKMSLRECLYTELCLTRTVTVHPDFAEGVRSVLVDKDGTARWTPPTIEEVQTVEPLFG
ncbi:enoyl-CoA hydratase/isomerase family protein [Acetobacteraceae bacterium H6797]|nr:enoyl-CoA hydratase/isomerase family protein [Acetobacteraceae bacterium H6797]